MPPDIDLDAAAPTDRTEVMKLAARAPRGFYDARYRAGYRTDLLESGYDACVLAALHWALVRARSVLPSAPSVLDVGCGQGRMMGVLEEELRAGEMHGVDVSPYALELAERRFPDATYGVADAATLPYGDRRFDFVTMIDVIEHVADPEAAVAGLARVLRPGGAVLMTTPCANVGSSAWLFNATLGEFEATPNGRRRFATDEPAHLTRFRSRELAALLAASGLRAIEVRWWGHVFTPIADKVLEPAGVSRKWRDRVALLDWRMARRLPTGAAMAMLAWRPVQTP